MTARHWSDDELIGHLYGVGPEDGHLEQCQECAQRWQVLVGVRQQALKAPPMSEELLAGQRQAIYGRLAASSPKRGWLPFAPAAIAAAAVILLAVVLYRPVPTPAPGLGIPDAELYADVYSIVQSNEPLAVEPMHALFEARE
jgi:anti-sigma factor RsiW